MTVSDEMLDKLNFYSKCLSMNRSRLVTFLCARGLMSLDKNMILLENLGEEVAHDLLVSSLEFISENDRLARCPARAAEKTLKEKIACCVS